MKKIMTSFETLFSRTLVLSLIGLTGLFGFLSYRNGNRIEALYHLVFASQESFEEVFKEEDKWRELGVKSLRLIEEKALKKKDEVTAESEAIPQKKSRKKEKSVREEKPESEMPSENEILSDEFPS